jgi:hypothetical protein
MGELKLRTKNRRIALVGMAHSTRSLAPFDNPTWEIWGINEAYAKKNKNDDEPFMKRWDRWFQLHQRWDFLREANFNHRNHPLWIMNEIGECRECGGRGKIGKKICWDCGGEGFYDPATDGRDRDFPIYMQEAFEDILNSVEYPIEEIFEDFSFLINEEQAMYFTSTFPLAIALAIHEHKNGQPVDEIGIYGIHMQSGTEYNFQKPCMEFWLGVALGEGIELTFPSGCPLLGTSEPIYAYEREVGTFSEMHSEIRIRALEKQFLTAQAKANQAIGEKNRILQFKNVEKGQSAGRKEKLEQDLIKAIEAEINAKMQMNATWGALQEQQHVMNELKAQKTSENLVYLTKDNKQEVLLIDEVI